MVAALDARTTDVIAGLPLLVQSEDSFWMPAAAENHGSPPLDVVAAMQLASHRI